tara:strand:- start:7612 stop:8226 length:615 start_codon:yes stop_codon:yes gene_type:complete
MNKPIFITLEGIEGSGKSTSLDFIKSYFHKKNIKFINTREPGGGPLGKDLRKVLLDKNQKIGSEIELLLMMADRGDHIKNIINPALKKGISVISDRFHDSTIAYQGAGRNIDSKLINSISNLINIPEPNLTLLFDLPVEEALKRVKKRGSLDRFESETFKFHNRIRKKYLDLSELHSNRFRVIDSRYNLESVEKNILKILEQFI